MPTLFQLRTTARDAAVIALQGAEATFAATAATEAAARATLQAAADALGAENEAGARIRSALATAANPADVAALAAQLALHVTAARSAAAAVLDAHLNAVEATAGLERARAAGDVARAALAAAVADLSRAAAEQDLFAAWKITAHGLVASLPVEVAALAAARADAAARVSEDVPAALQAIARARQATALAALDAAGGRRALWLTAEADRATHLDTGGPDDAVAARAIEFEQAKAALVALGRDGPGTLTNAGAALAAIAARPPLSAAVRQDIADRTPAGAPTPAELEAWESAVPDEAWLRLRILDAANRRLDGLSAADPAAVVAAFDAAEDALATALQARATFQGEAATRAAAAVALSNAFQIHNESRDALLLAALRGDR